VKIDVLHLNARINLMLCNTVCRTR